MTQNFQPAYTIAYIDPDNPPPRRPIDFPPNAEVAVSSYSMDAQIHFGKPKTMSFDRLPVFLFQLADAGYTIVPSDLDGKLGIRALSAFSPEFMVKHNMIRKENQ